MSAALGCTSLLSVRLSIGVDAEAIPAYLRALFESCGTKKPEGLLYTSNHNHCRRLRPSARKGHRVQSGEAERRRFEEVLETLEKERQRFDEDLKRLTAAAAYLRSLLPVRRRRRSRLRQRCTTTRRRIIRCER